LVGANRKGHHTRSESQKSRKPKNKRKEERSKSADYRSSPESSKKMSGNRLDGPRTPTKSSNNRRSARLRQKREGKVGELPEFIEYRKQKKKQSILLDSMNIGFEGGVITLSDDLGIRTDGVPESPTVMMKTQIFAVPAPKSRTKNLTDKKKKNSLIKTKSASFASATNESADPQPLILGLTAYDSIEISDYDSSADDEIRTDENFLPKWARKRYLNTVTKNQIYKNPELAFGRMTEAIDLAKIFISSYGRSSHRESGIWSAADKVTEAEEMNYEEQMNYNFEEPSSLEELDFSIQEAEFLKSQDSSAGNDDHIESNQFLSQGNTQFAFSPI